MQFGSVEEPYWTDRPAIIVGAGTSLKGFDYEQLRGLGYVIAVNGAMHHLPWADAWITLDHLFISHCRAFLSQPGPPLYIPIVSERVIGKLASMPHIKRATYLKRKSGGGQLSYKPDTLECGGTSGYAALNLAYLKRAMFIVLFGFDYRKVEGETHADPAFYYWQQHKSDWKTWASMFDGAKQQLDLDAIKVINASPESAITAFPRVTHEEAILQLKSAGLT